MELTLSVTRYQELPPERSTRITLGEQGGTIGRHTDNDLVLPDPDRWVSAQHARIEFRAGRFYLTDVSTNGTFVNHSPRQVTPGQAVQLDDGDELSIGAYEIAVSLAQRMGIPEPDAPFDPFAEQKPSVGEFAPTGEGETTPDVLDLVEATPSEPGPVQDRQPLIDLWEPNGGPYSPADQWSPAESLDKAFGAGEPKPPQPPSRPGGSESDHTPAEQAFFHTPAAIPEDYDLLTGDTKGESPSEQPQAIAPEPEFETFGLSQAVTPEPPPGPATAQPRQAEEPAQPAPPHPVVPETELLQAFLQGLGRPDTQLPPEASAQFMNSAGELLRELTQGLMQVLVARASFKSELRIEMTTIRPIENNPFKFSVGVQDALTNLLFRHTTGFLPPIEAAQEAYDDVRAHEMAIIAGLRSALRAQLQRFKPEELEQHFSRQSVLDNLLPIARKAKCWDLFTEVYADVARDASEGFLQLFGDAFTRAYEEQVSRLKRSRERPQN